MKDFRSNIKLFILAVGIIAVWRGLWGLMDIYLFPNNPSLSFIISIVGGVIILYLHDHRLNELV